MRSIRHVAKILPAALCLLGSSAGGATYYVAVNGSDFYPGTQAAPFQSLQQAANRAGPGDTVILRDGVYGHGAAVTGGDLSNENVSAVWLRNSGAPSAWITFKAENKWGAILDCEMMCDSYINLFNASYIVVQDFVITRGFKEGIHSNDAAHHIVLRGNRIEFIANRPSALPYGLDGMYTNARCHDFLIEGNVFHDIGRTTGLFRLNLDHGLYMSATNVTVVNNVFYNLTKGWSIQLAQGATNWLIAHNTFAFSNPAEDGQIMLWEGNTNITIQNNIFYNPSKVAVTRYAAQLSSCAIDHNLVYRSTFSLFSDLSVMSATNGCALGVNRTGADPMFVNASTPPYDFHLRPGSPAIGAGVALPGVDADFDGTPRPINAAPDIGAFVFTPPDTARTTPDMRARRARLR